MALALLILQPILVGLQHAPEWQSVETGLREMNLRIQSEVEELRGLQFKSQVGFEWHTAEQYEDFCRRRIESDLAGAAWRFREQTYTLLGFIESDDDLQRIYFELSTAGVEAHYDFRDSKKCYFVGEPHATVLAEVTMAHELCHALEDQHYDFRALMRAQPGHMDARFALRAVLEGSAVNLMHEYAYRVVPRRLREQPEPSWLSTTPGDRIVAEPRLAAEHLPPAERLPPPERLPGALLARATWPYRMGARFLTHGEARSVKTSVWEHPPTSSEQVLHPEKYWEPDRLDPPRAIELPDLSAELGSEWSLVDSDVLGELGAYFLVQTEADEAESSPQPWAAVASAGWGGDRFQLYACEGGQAVLLLATIWDTTRDRNEFVDAIETAVAERHSYLRRVHLGRHESSDRALLFFGTDSSEAALSSLETRLLALEPQWR